MNIRLTPCLVFVSCLALAGSMPAGAQNPVRDLPPLDATARAAIVADLLGALNEVYVFPETAQKMAELVRQKLAGGAYDSLGEVEAFTNQLTEDLQSVSHDRHLRVRPAPPLPAAGEPGPSPEERARRYEAAVRRDNACFRKVELLAGNVGYVKFDCFMQADLGGSTAVAVMGFLSGADALIFDLRENGGGSPSMIQLLTSYLVPGEDTTHLNSFYIREGDRTEQYWTQSWVPGTRRLEVPVFVLTSKTTFSAAEEFTYNLKNLKRATIVGETTGGGAHPVREHRVEGYPVAMMLPFGRAVNPITGTNWEGTGVTPDIAVPAADALRAAHVRALESIADKATDPEIQQTARFARTVIEGRGQAITLTAQQMAAFVGSYGPRQVTLEDGALWYQRGAGRKHRLQPLGGDRFLVGELTDFMVRFERQGGRVVKLVGLYFDGNEEASSRE